MPARPLPGSWRWLGGPFGGLVLSACISASPDPAWSRAVGRESASPGARAVVPGSLLSWTLTVEDARGQAVGPAHPFTMLYPGAPDGEAESEVPGGLPGCGWCQSWTLKQGAAGVWSFGYLSTTAWKGATRAALAEGLRLEEQRVTVSPVQVLDQTSVEAGPGQQVVLRLVTSCPATVEVVEGSGLVNTGAGVIATFRREERRWRQVRATCLPR